MKSRIIDIIKRLWFPLFMLLCFIVLSIRLVFGQDAEVSEARHLAEIEQREKAIQLLIKSTEKYPTTPKIWFHLGMIQLKNAAYTDASQSFDKGMALDPKEGLFYVGLGNLSLVESNPEKAESYFNKALSMSKSKDLDVLKFIAEGSLQHRGSADKAINLLEKAKSIDGDDPEVAVLLGDAYLAQNNGGPAISSYERAAALHGKSAKPHYKIGLVYLRSRNFTAAEAAFLRAISIDSSYTLAYKELGELYYQLKEGKKAVEAYEKYLSMTEDPQSGKMKYAFFLFMAKDFSKANKVFSSLASQANVSSTLLRFYAFSLYEAGEFEQSGKTFEQYFATVGREEIEAADHAYYGRLLLKQQEDSLAVNQFIMSLMLEQNQLDIQQVLAETLLRMRRYPEAIDAFEKLSKLRAKPMSQDLYALGRAYYFNKQFKEADGVFQKLIELQPNMAIGYLWAARTNSNLDPESEAGLAKPYYEAVVEKARGTPETSKNELVEAYSYLGYFHFLKQELSTSKTYWQKVLELNPNDMKAKEALKAIQ